MSEEVHLTIRYSDAGDGWLTAQVAEIRGAISEGRSRAEARSNMLDALELLLTPDEDLAGVASDVDSESLGSSPPVRGNERGRPDLSQGGAHP